MVYIKQLGYKYIKIYNILYNYLFSRSIIMIHSIINSHITFVIEEIVLVTGYVASIMCFNYFERLKMFFPIINNVIF